MLNAEGLSVQFKHRGGATLAFANVSLDVAQGEIHGLVGEPTIGAAIMRLLPAGLSEAFFAGPTAPYSRYLQAQTPTVRFGGIGSSATAEKHPIKNE